MSIRLKAKVSPKQNVSKQLSAAMQRGVKRATVYLHTACRQAVNRSNPRNRKTGTNDSPSRPGEPPRVRTGFGRDNVAFEFTGKKGNFTGRVGVRQNAWYMIALELGANVPAHRIIPKRGRALKIPWRGPVVMDPPKRKNSKAKAAWFGRDKRTGMNIYHAVLPSGKTMVVYRDHTGYFYWRRAVNVPAFRIAPRPWLVPTFNRVLPTMLRLFEAEVKGVQ